LPPETAEQLLTDSDAKVRYEALKSLIVKGRIFSDAEAKKVLVKEVQRTGFGLLGAAGALDSGETCWSHFKLQRLSSLSDKELEAVVVADLMFDRDPYFILAERHFKRRGENLRRAVDNQFKEEFSQTLHSMNESFGEHADLLEKTRSLEDFLRKEFTRKGLDIICRKAKPCDLGRVRLTLKSGFVNYSAADIEYLRKFGEWEDIALIIDSFRRPDYEYNNSLVPVSSEHKYRTAARAMYELGKTRLPEVLAMSAPNKLLSQLIVQISDKAFRNLNDASINLLLLSEDDTVRKSAAIKCVKALPKRRITKLLTDYISGDKSHYYNVVHWLDFGVSSPRDRALLAAEKVLNKYW
jgi:hypothetical protein